MRPARRVPGPLLETGRKEGKRRRGELRRGGDRMGGREEKERRERRVERGELRGGEERRVVGRVEKGRRVHEGSGAKERRGGLGWGG